MLPKAPDFGVTLHIVVIEAGVYGSCPTPEPQSEKHHISAPYGGVMPEFQLPTAADGAADSFLVSLCE